MTVAPDIVRAPRPFPPPRQSDPYPSRTSSVPSISPRHDPVLHGGTGAPGPLSPDELRAYERDGFLFFDRFLSLNEVAALRSEMETLWRSAGPDDEAVIREPGGDTMRSIFRIHETSPVFAQLARDRRVVTMAEQLLASGVYIHQSRINFKPGFDGKEFYWHSDFETWHAEDGMPRMRAVSVSIALSDNTPLNGPLMIIPGSHRYFVSCVGETPEDHYRSSLRRQEYGVPDHECLTRLVKNAGAIAAPAGKAGSLLLFECNAMHGSNGNITPDPRSNVFFVYNSVENALTAPFAGTRPRPDFVATREPRPIVPD
ncbi:MAG: ectoine hydroxylase [Alphaproteobacteria bacterium]